MTSSPGPTTPEAIHREMQEVLALVPDLPAMSHSK